MKKENAFKVKMNFIEMVVITILYFVVSVENIYAQTVSSKSTLGSMEAFDANGKPFATQNHDHIWGSPLLNTEWGVGVVSYKNGKVVNPIQIQFNLQKNELYFQQDGKKFMFTDTVSEFRIIYAIKDSAYSEKYRSGYPSSGKNKITHFYQVIADGKNIQLISDRTRKLLDTYTYAGGENFTYRDDEVLYVYDVPNKRMVEIKNLKNSKAIFLSAFPDRKSDIERICVEQKSEVKTREEVIALVNALQ
jgi:hypothetical protein